MIRLGFRAALMALGMASLAACVAAPRYPITQGAMGTGSVSVVKPRYAISQDEASPTPSKQTAPPSDDEGAPPTALRSSSVETRTLGAPGSKPGPLVSSPPPASDPPSSPSSDDEDGAALRGRQTDGLPLTRAAPPPALEVPHSVQVQPFENIYDVAERVRTPLRAIIDLNGLKPPYALTPGMMLRVPPPVVYTVVEGDTLFGVARRFSIDPRSLANLNDIPLETRLKPGQRLALPSLVKDKGPNSAANGPRPDGLSKSVETAASTGYARPSPGSPSGAGKPTPTAKADASVEHATAEPLPPRIEAPPVAESQITALGKGKFQWPVKGSILSNFGPKGAGQRNDGVNIAATAGDSVKAAAAGTVVYAGNSIPAFGNLVLVKHPGGWATLYGNLGKITVKNNAQVAQGQEVGTAGISGAVDKPQVHFEIRYAQSAKDKAKPYDPASLLP